jgi:hypothetical protein
VHLPEVYPYHPNGYFPWTVTDLDHQHYVADIICGEDQFDEHWDVARTLDGMVQFSIKLERSEPWLRRHPDYDKQIFSCTDDEFNNNQVVTSRSVANTSWPVDAPLAQIRPDGNVWVGMLETPPRCWKALTIHMGDATLPLTLPSGNPLIIPILIYGALVLGLPLYALLALYRMGVPLIRSNYEKSNVHRRSGRTEEL